MKYNIYVLILLWVYYLNLIAVNSYISNIIDKNPSFKNRLIKCLWYYMKCKTIIEKKYNLISTEINKIYDVIHILIFENEEVENILMIKMER